MLNMSPNKPLLFGKQVSWSFRAHWSSCLKSRVKAIEADSGVQASERGSVHLSGYSVQWLAECKNNKGAAAAAAAAVGALPPHGRLGSGYSLGEELGASWFSVSP